jgi:repressor LexA
VTVGDDALVDACRDTVTRSLSDAGISDRASARLASGVVAALFDGPLAAIAPTPVRDDRPPISERDRRILTFIAAHVREHGYPPTVREIGQHVGLSSTSSVAHRLDTLAGRGYIVRDPDRPRAIRVVPPLTEEPRS